MSVTSVNIRFEFKEIILINICISCKLRQIEDLTLYSYLKLRPWDKKKIPKRK